MSHVEPGIYRIKSLSRENGVLTLDKRNKERVVIADDESTWKIVSAPHTGSERTAFNLIHYNPVGGIEDLALEVEAATPRANVYARPWSRDSDHQKWLIIPITASDGVRFVTSYNYEILSLAATAGHILTTP